jgi:hypothetical protein
VKPDQGHLLPFAEGAKRTEGKQLLVNDQERGFPLVEERRKIMKPAFSSLDEAPFVHDLDTQTAAEQLRAWIASPEGWRKFQEAELSPALIEHVCHAVETTQASRYGLLITPAFTRLFSTLHEPSLKRLEAVYRAAAECGLCCWWNGQRWYPCHQPQVFFLLVRTLPPALSDIGAGRSQVLSCRQWRRTSLRPWILSRAGAGGVLSSPQGGLSSPFSSIQSPPWKKFARMTGKTITSRNVLNMDERKWFYVCPDLGC